MSSMKLLALLFLRLCLSPKWRKRTAQRPSGAIYLHEAWLDVMLRRMGRMERGESKPAIRYGTPQACKLVK